MVPLLTPYSVIIPSMIPLQTPYSVIICVTVHEKASVLYFCNLLQFKFHLNDYLSSLKMYPFELNEGTSQSTTTLYGMDFL